MRLIANGYTNPADRRAAARRRAHRQDLPRSRDREARVLLARRDHRVRAANRASPTSSRLRDIQLALRSNLWRPLDRRSPPRATGSRGSRRGPSSTRPTAPRRPRSARSHISTPVVRKLIELGYERALRQSYLGLGRCGSRRRAARRRVARARDRLRDARHGRGARPLPHAVPLAQRDGRSAPRTPIVVVQSELIAAARRAAAPRRVRARGGAHPRRPPALPHRARASSCCSRRTARLPLPLAAGAHRADGVGARHRAERRPRRRARHTRPAGRSAAR